MAIEQTATELYFTSIKDNVKGKRNNNNPVILFIIECRDISCFLEAYPKMILLILITAMPPPHIHNHPGIWIAGNSLIIDAATKRRSATVSILAPNSLVLFVFLAIKSHRKCWEEQQQNAAENTKTSEYICYILSHLFTYKLDLSVIPFCSCYCKNLCDFIQIIRIFANLFAPVRNCSFI